MNISRDYLAIGGNAVLRKTTVTYPLAKENKPNSKRK
jgi:hypothetical protein